MTGHYDKDSFPYFVIPVEKQRPKQVHQRGNPSLVFKGSFLDLTAVPLALRPLLDGFRGAVRETERN